MPVDDVRMGFLLPGADANVENTMGNSALMLATMNDEIEVIQVLKDAGKEYVEMILFYYALLGVSLIT